jgi:hypothetical protein
MSCSERLLELLGRLKALAGEYYELAGRALVGVADEIAQYEAAARLADVELAAARDRGYAAIRRLACGDQRLQINGRRVLVGGASRQRTGSIELNKEWDSVLLVLLDDRYEATAIDEADQRALTNAISGSRSGAGHERAQLSVTKVTSIGQRIWADEANLG